MEVCSEVDTLIDGTALLSATSICFLPGAVVGMTPSDSAPSSTVYCLLSGENVKLVSVREYFDQSLNRSRQEVLFLF